MSSVDMTIVAVSLPAMMREMNTNLAWISWTLTGRSLSQTIVMGMAGKLSDDWGRKRVLMGAVALFTVTSLAAGLAPNVYLLIVCRVLQGIGAGAFMPAATGIVSDVFGERRRATAIGLFGSIFPIGGLLGPNIGGLIVDHLSWRWIFFVNVPIGIALLLLGLAILPSGRTSSRRRQIDLVGAGLFVVAMLAVLYAMTTWANHPEQIEHPMIWVFLALGVISLVTFLWHEGRTPEPIIDLALLRWRPFLAANVYNVLFGAAMFGFFSFIPYYANVVYGMSASQTGLVLTPRSITMILTSAVTSFFIIRLGYRLPMVLGMVLLSLTMVLLSRTFHDASLLGWHMPDFAFLAVQVAFAGLAMGIANPAANNAALDLVPDKVSTAAGLRGMTRSLGGVFGTAALVLALSHFDNKVLGLQYSFLAIGLIVLATVPLAFMIPDTARQRRLADKGRGHTMAAPSR